MLARGVPGWALFFVDCLQEAVPALLKLLARLLEGHARDRCDINCSAALGVPTTRVGLAQWVTGGTKSAGYSCARKCSTQSIHSVIHRGESHPTQAASDLRGREA